MNFLRRAFGFGSTPAAADLVDMLELEQLLSQPWAMEPGALGKLVDVLRAGLSYEQIKARRGADRAAEAPPYVVREGVAVVPMNGVILKSVPEWMAWYGINAVSTVKTQQAIAAAANDSGVKAILLSVDSPGGTLAGVEELADTVYSLRGKKPVLTHADDLMASAAFWVGAQAQRVTANRTAAIGSIGVYGVMYDASELASKEGVKVHVIATHELKGAGVFGAKITDRQLEDAQRFIDGAGALFKAAVARGRGLSAAAVDELATGQVWFADEAAGRRLVDGVARFDEAHASAISAAGGGPIRATGAAPATTSVEDKKPAPSGTENEMTIKSTAPETPAGGSSGAMTDDERKELEMLRARENLRAESEAEKTKARKVELIDGALASGRITPKMRPHLEKIAELAGNNVKLLEDEIALHEVKVKPKATGSTPSTEPGAEAASDDMRRIEQAFGVPVAFQKKIEATGVRSVSADGFALIPDKVTGADKKVFSLSAAVQAAVKASAMTNGIEEEVA